MEEFSRDESSCFSINRFSLDNKKKIISLLNWGQRPFEIFKKIKDKYKIILFRLFFT